MILCSLHPPFSFDSISFDPNFIDCFHLTIFVSESAKKLMRKKSEEDEQTLEELIIAVGKLNVS